MRSIGGSGHFSSLMLGYFWKRGKRRLVRFGLKDKADTLGVRYAPTNQDCFNVDTIDTTRIVRRVEQTSRIRRVQCSFERRHPLFRCLKRCSTTVQIPGRRVLSQWLAIWMCLSPIDAIANAILSTPEWRDQMTECKMASMLARVRIHNPTTL